MKVFFNMGGRTMQKRRLRILGGIFLGTILLTGCGNSGSSKKDNSFEKTGDTTEMIEEITVENTTDTTGESEKPEADLPTTESTPFSDSIDIETGEKSSSTTFFAMDTVIGLTVYGEDSEVSLKESADLIDRLDGVFSTERTDSEVYYLNNNGNAACSDELIEVIKMSQELSHETDGAFNIALYPLSDAWGFFSKNYRVPDDTEISELLLQTNPDNVEVLELPAREWSNAVSSGYADDEESGELLFGVRFKENGMKIDLGAIAKGYIADEVNELLTSKDENALTGAMISLGGSISFIGSKPDGKPWRVGIQNPYGSQGDYIAVISIDGLSDNGMSAMSVVTAGTYERYFEQDGNYYHHIIDPATGYPADTDIVSATIISSDSAVADALSTIAVLLGYDKTVELWHMGKYDFEMVLVKSDTSIYVTEGIADSFSSDLSFEVIPFN